jgi:putative membrane protein insertion efficiency factor
MIKQLPFHLYQWFISPAVHLLFGPTYGCRFVPTCSEYGIEVVHTFGYLRGAPLILKRICKCNPYTEAGYDPAPRDIGKLFSTKK